AGCGEAARGREEDGQGRVLQGARGGQGRPEADAERHGARALHGLDHRWAHVRLVGDPRRALGVQPARRDRGLDRRHPAHVGRRSVPVLDSGSPRVQGSARSPAGHARVRRRAARDQGGGARGSARPRRPRTLMLDPIAGAWGWQASAISPHVGGLINKTYVVRDDGGAPVAALQQLHPIFAAEVNLDIEAVTAHLAARGLETPRLLRTRDGRAWVEHEGRVWRALSWVAGESVHAVPSLAWAEAGGVLVGKYHRAVADFAYDYRFTRAGVHDTPAHLAKLRDRVAIGGDEEAKQLGQEILAAAAGLPALPDTAKRHVHGDLKISNLIFRDGPVRGVCLVDL